MDFVARNEFDMTIKELAEGRDWSAIDGLTWRDRDGTVRTNRPRAVLENMDLLPFVTPVYQRDLTIENYFIGYLKHPYISLYTGRGCKSRCTFCLWPQTVGGHRYRTRSVGHVVDEIRYAVRAFPQVQEFFFADDTFTADLPRAEAIARELGITIHGTFIMGLPGETKETIEETIRFAKDVNPHTLQVSLAAPYPGTALYKQAVEKGWLDTAHAELIDERGVQMAPLHYEHLSHTEIFDSVEDFYRRFYFRAPKIASIVGEMVRSPEMMKRRLREGVEFFAFLRDRRTTAP